MQALHEYFRTLISFKADSDYLLLIICTLIIYK